MILTVLLLASLALAYANGANDNFKGVATLFGSGTTSFRWAVVWATFTTFAGSLTAVVLAERLLHNFTGQGLVDVPLISGVYYVGAVAAGTGLTVLLATWMGIPISTTHGLVGALVGAGWMAGSAINLPKLGDDFFLPLLLSPLLALTATCMLYPVLRWLRRRLGVTETTCICVGNNVIETIPLGSGETFALQRLEQLSVSVGDAVTCQRRYEGRLLGLNAAAVLDRCHFLSAGTVSFARGLNDTPKIAALLLLYPHLSGFASMTLVGLAIAAGGILSVRRVAETMSRKITTMNHGQGFTANLITSVIVVAASRLGMPVSTTHVSCGSLFGIGAVTQQADWRMIGKIVVAWVTTLPAGAVLGAISFWVLKSI